MGTNSPPISRLDQLQRLLRLPAARQLIQQGAPAAAVQAAQLPRETRENQGQNGWKLLVSPRKTWEKARTMMKDGEE